MKGIVFTLDSIFALTIASFAISILVYLQFYSQVPLQISYSGATSTFQTLSTTNVSTLISSSAVAGQILGSGLAQNDTWPEPSGNSANDGYSYHGPARPSVAFLYTISANTISAGPIIAYGRVYFAAGPKVYALNATYGTLSWTYNNKNNINSMLAEGGSLIIENTTNLAKLNPYSGNQIWVSGSFSSYGTPTSQIVYADGKVFLGATSGSASGNIIQIASNNGTISGTKSLSGSPISLSSQGGVLGALIANTVEIQLYGTESSNITGPIWTVSASGYSTPGPDIAMTGNYIAAAVPSDVSFMVYSNGIVERTDNSGGLSAGVAFGAGAAVYQAYSSMYAISASSNSVLWNVAIPYYVPSPSSYTIPVIGGGMVYSIWSTTHASPNVVLAQNLSTGNIIWQKTLPYSSTSGYNYMALGNGRLYIALGRNLLALGPCPANANSSVIASAASLYLNGEGSCADYMLNYVRPMYNYSLYINSIFAPGISTANFNGNANSYISVPASNSLEPNSITITGWGYVASAGTDSCDVQNMVYDLGSYTGYALVYGWGNDVAFFIGNGTAWSQLDIGNKNYNGGWIFLAGTYDSSSGKDVLYENGAKIESGSINKLSNNANARLIGSGCESGSIANVQIYNKSLSATQIAQLYQEGIQGQPAFTSSLVAWYPLAGDPNDYSGLFNTGFALNVTYTSANYLPIRLKNAYEINRAASLFGITNASTGVSGTYNVSVVNWR